MTRSVKEAVYLRGLPDGATCDVHDWPTDGLGRRFVEEMRARHGKGGLNACGPCVGRAREDAKLKAALPPHEHLRKIYVDLDLEKNLLSVVAGDDTTLAWLDTPEVMGRVREVYDSLKGYRVAPDPPPGMKPLPVGIYGPRLIAAQIQQKLREAYPEEAIIVLPYSEVAEIVAP